MSDSPTPDASDLPIEVDVTTVAAMQQRGDDFVLLDVREQDEYDFAKLPGSRLVPMSQLADRMADLDPHRDDHIVVHCHHGGRSMHVTRALQSAGFTRVQNMAGGIDAWSQLVDQSVPRY
ncbi:putative adenylyltransferase/sulfurtransferase MoeZ [Rubripirellula lacrimiformis]|uniref:Putative adenylyltransferase/sulfurtransferase MoeZ n=1 Tax=Rubripirellula lacrimiformis TaxID=1930273 RepID=A0A517NL86_9BACT|nr:rhodanese-like domain-containing protein [Rubripirellula lacrimiformis]QDT07896.1 putative adenylyltransferase/sulfurtransferase MoeZ [Rubripirellula lacrimiformis]